MAKRSYLPKEALFNTPISTKVTAKARNQLEVMAAEECISLSELLRIITFSYLNQQRSVRTSTKINRHPDGSFGTVTRRIT